VQKRHENFWFCNAKLWNLIIEILW